MPELFSFAGLRFRTDVAGPLSQLTCPPYDVITPTQRSELLGRNPYNVVRVELPDGDYAGAARSLAEWQRGCILERDPVEALYGYRMTYLSSGGERRSTLGVVGALALEPPGQGILPHEQTTPKAKTDRLELLRATHANTSPIWCLCSQEGLAEAIGAVPPAAVATSMDEAGNEHQMWPITDRAVQAAIRAVVAAAPLLVADGHHRYETALAFRAEQGTGPAGGPGADGPGAVMALVVELSAQQLEVRAIHRVVTGAGSGEAVLAAFEADYELAPAPGSGGDILTGMVARGALAVVTAGGAHLARPRPGSAAESLELDSARADTLLAGVGSAELAYEHDPDAAVGAVRSGTAEAAVLCRPATVDQIAATGRGGLRMPPKTTFFWPKPLTGMVLRAW